MFSKSTRFLHKIHHNGFFCAFSVQPPILPNCCYNPPAYEGTAYDEAYHTRKHVISPSISLLYKKPIMLTRGYMQWVWDDKGKRYLDMFGGIATVSVGHCHPKVTEAAINQIKKLWHVSSIYLYPGLHEYAEKLAARLPDNLKVGFFCNSGSEANDIAMQMCRIFTGSFDIISLRNSYHGDSPYTVGLSGISKWKHAFPNGFGIHHAMNPDPYQGLWGGSFCRDSVVQTSRVCSCLQGHCEATDKYLNQLEELLHSSVPNKIAGFFAESIQGVGGTVQFPKSYLKKAYKIVKSHGGLTVADEVQTGFGRTGEFYWGFESHGVVPDIVTMAKGIGNGFPLAAVFTTPDIAKCLNNALMFNTYGGNPISCSVGSTVLDIIDEEKLMSNCQDVGTYLLHSLAKLQAKYEIVGDIRGKGLMIGMELVKNKNTREPLSVDDVSLIIEDAKNMGLLIGRGGSSANVFRIKPPMCITKEDADFCVAVLDMALEKFIKQEI